MKTVLFSCVGTSDPIRSNRDGPLLHILRKYRPDVVVLFITTEIQKLIERDDRHTVLRQHMKAAWGYEPEWHEEPLGIREVQDLDLVYNTMTPAMRKWLRRYGQEQLLVNVTSGSPQMQYLMIDLAQDVRYPHCAAVQVANPERKAGSSKRTNAPDYDIGEEIRENQDELADYADRCVEVEMVAAKRLKDWQQLRSFLEQRDFKAAKRLNMLAEPSLSMLEHLLKRSLLEKTDEGKMRGMLMYDQMYPIVFAKKDNDTKDLCEYFLILRNMQHADRITEFILRLSPFIVRLQQELISKLLYEQYQFTLNDVMVELSSGKKLFSVTRVQKRAPELMESVNQYFKEEVRDASFSIRLGNALLRSLGAQAAVSELFTQCEYLNEKLRNPAAHELRHFTESDFANYAGCSSKELIEKIEDLLPTVYPQYSEEAFRKYYRVYDAGIKYILDKK